MGSSNLLAYMKKRLSRAEEFDIMLIVLDKFLWVGMAIVGFGLWRIFTTTIANGISIMLIGIIVLILFLVIIVREYEVIG